MPKADFAITLFLELLIPLVAILVYLMGALFTIHLFLSITCIIYFIINLVIRLNPLGV